MEKISRFLYADWIKTDWISEYKEFNGTMAFGAGYTDKFGASHKRKVELFGNSLIVYDKINGFQETAMLKWRLSDEGWEISQSSNMIFLKSSISNTYITLECSETIASCNLEKGYESLYYMEYNTIPVLCLKLTKKCTIVTTVKW
jgi:hypothetical protein